MGPCICACVIQILTDAGQYVIRFGKSDAASKSGPATMVCSTFVLFWLAIYFDNGQLTDTTSMAGRRA